MQFLSGVNCFYITKQNESMIDSIRGRPLCLQLIAAILFERYNIRVKNTPVAP